MVYFKHIFFPIPPKLREKKIDGKRHYISPNGIALPSVTTVLSLLDQAGIRAWKNRVGETEANRVSGRALKNGTEMHTIVESFLDNKGTESFKNMVSQKLFEQMKSELLKINNIRAQEVQLYSEKIGVAGRVDCVADFDGKLSVIDFKSAKQKKQKSWITKYFLQATAYSEMFTELTKTPIEQIVILISAEDGTVVPYVESPSKYKDQLYKVIEDYKLRKEFENS
ncbi:hypothetical protein LCGC14_1168320 [marine sediment metagenome]|uniref:PD-(D/E)XK endonuclease-like domain-containing protein n=1 Tax=marine sediment metagenome TaxID=412755 RepID=A0A0F9MDJ6_9ZZZZ